MMPSSNNDFEPLDYFAALFEASEVQVNLGDGTTVNLRPAGLGLHFYLRHLEEKWSKGDVDSLARWLKVAGCPSPEQLTLEDVQHIVRAIKDVNGLRGKPAWLAFYESKEPSAQKYTDYPGRVLSRLIDVLARNYGWSMVDIINMPASAALLHIQECLLVDHNNKEWQYSLSEIAWSYDKSSGTSRLKPFKHLLWDREIGARQYSPIPPEIEEKYFPKGVIIDLTRPPDERRDSGA